jgi:hypothetical protein
MAVFLIFQMDVICILIIPKIFIYNYLVIEIVSSSQVSLTISRNSQTLNSFLINTITYAVNTIDLKITGSLPNCKLFLKI